MFELDYVQELLELDTTNHTLNASVGLASAITAYSRMYINLFRNILNNPCYYTDTYSLVLQHKLPNNYVGNQLGLFKLEHI